MDLVWNYVVNVSCIFTDGKLSIPKILGVKKNISNDDFFLKILPWFPVLWIGLKINNNEVIFENVLNFSNLIYLILKLILIPWNLIFSGAINSNESELRQK